MKTVRSKKYQLNLLMILHYIANDKVSASRNFQKELDARIEEIPNFQYRYKPSIYFNNANERNLHTKSTL